jgi:transposase
MFLKVTPQKNGRINMSIVEGYRNPRTKKTVHKVIENLGYADEYLDKYPDPVQHFRQLVREQNEEQKRLKKQKEIFLGTVQADEVMQEGENVLYGLGYLPLSSIYHQLKINQFFINRQRSLNIKYSLNDIMQLLVYTRVLAPASKQASFADKEKLAGTDFNCDLHDVYRALDHFAKYREDLLLHLHEQVSVHYKRQTDVVYYDVTNYYFEIDRNDDFRRKGFCKSNSRKPLVQMGLLLDSDSIPIAYRLFKGNTNDGQTLMPILQKTRQDYNLGRVIIVADKGINTGDNVAFTMVKGDGFIFSQTIRGGSDDFKAYALAEAGFIKKDNVLKQADEKYLFKMKSRPYPQKFWVTHEDDKKRQIPLDIKQIICYNEQYASRQRHKRAELIEKAEKIVDNPKRYNKSSTMGALRYVANIEYDAKTGEYIETKQLPYLDEEKIAEEAKYDGYYALITSEVNMPDTEVAKTYHGLWEIEHSFRITKTDLASRPVYVSLERRIEGHFLTCFIALLLLRLLDKRLAGKYCPEQIINSLKKYQICLIKDNVFRSTYYDPILADLGQNLGLSLNKKYLQTGQIRQLVADSKK